MELLKLNDGVIMEFDLEELVYLKHSFGNTDRENRYKAFCQFLLERLKPSSVTEIKNLFAQSGCNVYTPLRVLMDFVVSSTEHCSLNSDNLWWFREIEKGFIRLNTNDFFHLIGWSKMIGRMDFESEDFKECYHDVKGDILRNKAVFKDLTYSEERVFDALNEMCIELKLFFRREKYGIHD